MAGKVERTLNTMLNPFAVRPDQLLEPPGKFNTPIGRAVMHAGGLALTYGGLALLLRKWMLWRMTQKNTEQTEALKSLAEARMPVLSLDPSLRDVKKEIKLRELGTEEATDLPELKEAQEDQNFFYRATNLLYSLSQPDVSTKHLALSVAAVLSGIAGGYALANYSTSSNRKLELEDKENELANKIDKVLYNEYRRTRNQKTAAPERPTPEQARAGLKITAEANETRGLRDISPFDIPHLGGGIYFLWALLSAVAGFRAGQLYMDSVDPNRKRMKQLKRIADEAAKIRDAPVLFDVSEFPEVNKISTPSIKQIKTTAVQSSLPSMRKPLVDETDPYKELLKV